MSRKKHSTYAAVIREHEGEGPVLVIRRAQAFTSRDDAVTTASKAMREARLSWPHYADAMIHEEVAAAISAKRAAWHEPASK